MSKSSGDRFRRIIKVWRDDERARSRSQNPRTPPEPVENSRAPQPVPQPTRSAPRLTPPPPPSRRPTTPQESPPPASSKSAPAPVKPAASTPKPVPLPPLEPTPNLDELRTPADARNFLERLRTKTARIVQDFASGTLNQRQFQAIYSHYQRQRIEVEKALLEMPGSGAWRAAAVEGHTSFLRQQHAAQVLSYAIYETASGMPLAQVGDFKVDPGLLVPMLSSFRSITQELFGAGMKRTEIEGGRWLCFVPGRYTTLIAVYSAEPASLQLEMIEDLHRDFEYVNQMALSEGDASRLALTFTHLWDFEQQPNET